MPLPCPPPLRVIAVPGHLVADDLAYQNNNRFRFVGRAKSPARGTTGADSLEERFPPEASEYADDQPRRFVLRALQKRALLPLDEHTAKRAGVEPPASDLPKTSTRPAEKARKGGEA
jgi:hypothetical protein